VPAKSRGRKASAEDQRALNRSKAVSHDVRAKLLMILCEETASPVQMAKRLDIPTWKADYHVGVLVRLGCAELVDTKPRRGATEHFYRATDEHLVEGADWNELHKAAQDNFLGEVGEVIFEDLKRSREAGLIGSDEKAILTRTPEVLDEQGLEMALKEMEGWRARFKEIAAESASRIAEKGEAGRRYSSIFGLFELPSR